MPGAAHTWTFTNLITVRVHERVGRLQDLLIQRVAYFLPGNALSLTCVQQGCFLIRRRMGHHLLEMSRAAG